MSTAPFRPSPDSLSADAETGPDGLRRTLKRRHMNLIALGGVIGAGLFVGSGVVIHATGPAAIVSFLIAGAIIVSVMRMLAEMAVARPAMGSFYAYAREALGPSAGFLVGWMYWYFFVIVVALEAVAGARIVGLWLPTVPLWVTCLVLMALLTGTNLISARSYGEFEYWFSGIKVAAITVFLFLGALYLLGLWPHRDERCGGFSRGMRQKAALAGALIHDPRLLLLDEPLTGLDVAIARDVKDLLRERVRAGATIILTTHILDVAERIADRIGIIVAGRLLAEGRLEDLRARSGAGDATLEDVFLRLVAAADTTA